MLKSIQSDISNTSLTKEVLNIFSTANFLSYLGLDFFLDFSSKYSDYTLNLVEFPDSALHKMFHDNQVNIGFLTGPIDHSVFNATFLTEDDYVIIISPQSPLSLFENLSVENISDYLMAIKGKEFSIYNNHISEILKKIHYLQNTSKHLKTPLS